MDVVRKLPIRRQVALSALVLLLPVVLGAAWSSTRARQERAVELRAEAASVAVTSAAYFDQYLRGLETLASAIAHDRSLVEIGRAECDRLFAEILRDQPLLLNVMLQAADGTIKGSGLPVGERPANTLPHVQQVLSTRRPVVSDLTVGPVTGKPAILFAYPVLAGVDDTRVAGILTLGLNLAALESTFQTIPLADGSIVTLTTRLGLVLARSRDADRYIGTTAQIPARSSQDASGASSTIVTDQDGVARIVASVDVHRAPWVISVGIPTSVVNARLWPLWRRNLVIAITSVLVSVLASFWFGRNLAQQLNHLRSAAQRIAQGDLSPVDPHRSLNQELSALQSTFGTMAQNLDEAHRALDQRIMQERKTREALETLQRQVVRQERLAAVGLLVSGVAHELNNPLQAIMGASELLERRNELSDEALKEIGLVKTQGYRASEIIRSLSRFGTQRSIAPDVVDMRDVVAEVVQLRFADLDSAGISCDMDDVASGKIHVNFTEIEQVVLNFVVNAQQAIETARVPDGRVVIRSFDAGPFIRLEVLDNGPGVPQADEAKLFQPFFTTKPVGEGTGLGLSVSYGIIDAYGGKIGYQRNEWGGATFYFELPRAGSTPEAHAKERVELRRSG